MANEGSDQPDSAPETLEQVEADETVAAQGQAAQDQSAEVQEPPSAPVPAPADPPPQEQPVPAGPDGDQPTEQHDESPPQQQPPPSNEVAFSWQASEFVHHHKNAAWYFGLFGGVAVLVALTALLHSWLEMAAIIVMSGAIVVYARKPPRTLQYELMTDGVVIDGRKFPFASFRSFGVVEDSEWHSVDLEPVKRFQPRMTMLFDSQDLPEIVGHLEQHLTREDREPDLVEQLTRYLRF